MSVYIDLEEDKRETKRILFSREDGILADAHFSKGLRRRASAFVVNISEEGISLLLPRQKSKSIGAGDAIVLSNIHTPEPLGVITTATVEVKYILADDNLDYATVGCEFIELMPHYRKSIHRFVEFMLNEMGSALYKKGSDIEY